MDTRVCHVCPIASRANLDSARDCIWVVPGRSSPVDGPSRLAFSASLLGRPLSYACRGTTKDTPYTASLTVLNFFILAPNDYTKQDWNKCVNMKELVTKLNSKSGIKQL